MKALFLLLVLAVSLLAQRDLKLESAQKLALVVGNGAYPKWPLRNPANDARAVAQALTNVGFSTTSVIDVTLQNLDRAVSAFVAKVKQGDTVAFYYAGHGIQLEGENYLVPVDFDAKDEADAKYAAYAASRVQERIEKAGARVTLVVLDACRNNPFAATRSTSGGLAAMGTGKGTLIAFATAPGKTADDNPNGNNGLFTTHFITALQQPGLTLDQVFNRVRERVHNASGGKQVPWTVSSVIGEVYLRPGSGPAPPAAIEAAPSPPTINTLVRTASNPLVPVSQPKPDFSAAVSAFQRGDVQQAKTIAMETLRQEPTNQQALFLLTTIYYKQEQWDFLVPTAVQAIKAGATIPFAVGHHHTLTGAHGALLTISSKQVEFQSVAGSACSQKNMIVPLASLGPAQQSTNAQGILFFNLKITDEKGKVQNFNFVDPSTEVRNNPDGLPILVAPPRAMQLLRAMAEIFNQARQP